MRRFTNTAVLFLALTPLLAVASPKLLAENDWTGAEAPDTDYRAVVRKDLKRDLLQLSDERPSYASTIAFGISGSVPLVAGAGLLAYVFTPEYSYNSNPYSRALTGVGDAVLKAFLGVIGFAVVLVGAVLVVVAVVKYFGTRSDLVAHDEKVAEVTHRLDRLERETESSRDADSRRPSVPMFEVGQF